MTNILLSGFPTSSNGSTAVAGNSTVTLYNLATRLDGLLLVVKSCAGASCREPWGALDPTGAITSLSDALKTQYDGYFESLPRVFYSECEPAYFISAEGPQFSAQDVYTGNSSASFTVVDRNVLGRKTHGDQPL
jgi:hypothetical protein